jgi:hypothetical protein
LPERKLRITIVDGAAGRSCAVGCGTDWSRPEEITAARREVRSRFGNRVSLEYLELRASEETPAKSRMERAVRGMPLPVLLANGRPRIAGKFDLRQLIDVIEVGIEERI